MCRNPYHSGHFYKNPTMTNNYSSQQVPQWESGILSGLFSTVLPKVMMDLEPLSVAFFGNGVFVNVINDWTLRVNLIGP